MNQPSPSHPAMPPAAEVFRGRRLYVWIALTVAITAAGIGVLLWIHEPWVTRPSERLTHPIIAAVIAFCMGVVALWAWSRRCRLTSDEVVISAIMEREAVRWDDVRVMVCFPGNSTVSFYLEDRPIPVQLSPTAFEGAPELLAALRRRLPPERIRETTGPDPEAVHKRLRVLPGLIAASGALTLISAILMGPVVIGTGLALGVVAGLLLSRLDRQSSDRWTGRCCRPGVLVIGAFILGMLLLSLMLDEEVSKRWGRAGYGFMLGAFAMEYLLRRPRKEEADARLRELGVKE